MKSQKNLGSTAVSYINGFRKKYTKAFYAIVVTLALVLMGGCSTALGENNDPAKNIKQETVVSNGVLSFTVEADKWDTVTDGSIAVIVTGESDGIGKISRQYTVIPGEACATDLGAGNYEIALVNGKATKGSNLFTATAVSVTFDGETDKNAILRMSLDAAKMKQIEEEAAAKKAAEEKAAKEKAEAEKQAKAKEQAAAKQQSSSKSSVTAKSSTQVEATVYIASSGNGKKYHSRSTCSNMKGTTALTISQAQSRGYTACKKCC